MGATVVYRCPVCGYVTDEIDEGPGLFSPVAYKAFVCRTACGWWASRLTATGTCERMTASATTAVAQTWCRGRTAAAHDATQRCNGSAWDCGIDTLIHNVLSTHYQREARSKV